MNWLLQIAPTLAHALGGPLAGLAVTALCKALNLNESEVNGIIQTGKLSADQIAQVKIAEIELQKQAQELGLDFEKLAVADSISARNMEISTKSIIPPILATITTIGFFGILALLFFNRVDPTNNALMIMLGSLGTAWTGVIGFYFGSSASSQNKDQMLYNSTPMTQPTTKQDKLA
jgi:hypothetical protein